MKIGLIAFHAAPNYGAFLQMLSTVEYVRAIGDTPYVINWLPKDAEKNFRNRAIPEVLEQFSHVQKDYYPLTRLCRSTKEVAHLITEIGIDAVIVGSDAILQHHPLGKRIYFPCRRIVYIQHMPQDHLYPSPFWGAFNDYLKNPIPVAILSGSSQDCKFYDIKGRTKARMKNTILQYKYISVRDEWTQSMISYLTDGVIKPEITPDPVFAFNYNAGHLILSKEEILKKYRIPDDYIIVSFKGPQSVTQEWISEFQTIARKEGTACVRLPYADGKVFGELDYSLPDILPPLDWYALIKYSKAYVGNNMHPIIVSLHNVIPFFSFDNYGLSKVDGRITDGESSKIYHILKQAGLLDYRSYIGSPQYQAPSASFVYNKIKNFDTKAESEFAESYYTSYKKMMDKIYKSISKE